MRYASKIKAALNQLYPHLNKTAAWLNENYGKIREWLRKKNISWWRLSAIAVFAIVFLYYPLGGLMISNTTTPPYHPQRSDGSLYTIDSLSHLVNQEVNHKIWTPNLPILFPSYFLDNMPNFQLGVMSAVGSSAAALQHLSFVSANSNAGQLLHDAAEFLQYPGTIWLVSPQNRLLPATSSNTQYKKGRRKLNDFNRDIALGKTTVAHDTANFSLLLKAIKKDIVKLIKRNDSHIREYQTAFFDFQADDVFYFAYGKLYAYAQISNALGLDFKEVLIKHDVYQQWTSYLKMLNQAAELQPLIVRNGALDSLMTPNHIAAINYYAAMAVNYLNTIINKL